MAGRLFYTYILRKELWIVMKPFSSRFIQRGISAHVQIHSPTEKVYLALGEPGER